MFDKLKFWKKDDDFGTDSSFRPDSNLGDDKNVFGQSEENTPHFGAQDTLGNSGFEKGDQGISMDHKTPDTDFGSNIKTEFSSEPIPSSSPFGSQQGPSGQPNPVQYNQPVQQNNQQQNHELLSKDMQIIASKLDILKVQMDNINQRLANIEAKVYEDKNKTWYR